MNDLQVAEVTLTGEIPCLIVPLIDGSLLLPTMTVAEMAPMIEIDAVDGAPTWLIGMYAWRDTQVPVLSYEVLNGADSVRLHKNGRIAVLNNTGANEDLPFLAIPTQGIPRMARVSEDDIDANHDEQNKPCDLLQVKVGLESFAIPDISALENVYLQYRNGL